nr:6730_t:CDS:2 [Entrophospora candida]CAG8481106.1 763_t:CDS:2 [Entrophospora candida]
MSNNPLYSPLPKYVQNSQVVKNEEQPLVSETTKKFIPNFVMDTLETNFEIKKNSAAKAYDAKLKDKVILLDNPKKKSEDNKKRLIRLKRKQKSITSKEKKELGIYDIPKDCQNAFSQKLLKADFHGAILTVSKSKCPSYIGVTGIIVQETENMFKFVTKNDVLKSLPKANNVFTFIIHNHEFTLYGNQFRFRSAIRATKKFKNKPTIDL